jgi:hypothetical protein
VRCSRPRRHCRHSRRCFSNALSGSSRAHVLQTFVCGASAAPLTLPAPFAMAECTEPFIYGVETPSLGMRKQLGVRLATRPGPGCRVPADGPSGAQDGRVSASGTCSAAKFAGLGGRGGAAGASGRSDWRGAWRPSRLASHPARPRRSQYKHFRYRSVHSVPLHPDKPGLCGFFVAHFGVNRAICPIDARRASRSLRAATTRGVSRIVIKPSNPLVKRVPPRARTRGGTARISLSDGLGKTTVEGGGA